MKAAIPLSEGLLALMRRAAQAAVHLHEPFITPRAVLLALCEDPELGPPLERIVLRERVFSAPPETAYGAERVQEALASGEAAVERYDTLAFKTPSGAATLWLSRSAYELFLAGARRARGTYDPRDVALAMAAQAVRAPGVLAALRVEPGRFADAVRR